MTLALQGPKAVNRPPRSGHHESAVKIRCDARARGAEEVEGVKQAIEFRVVSIKTKLRKNVEGQLYPQCFGMITAD